MFSLRNKLAASHLALSLLLLAISALITRELTLKQFNNLLIEKAADQVSRVAVAYYTTYGTWERALEEENFLRFLTREQSSELSTAAPNSQRTSPSNTAFNRTLSAPNEASIPFVLVDQHNRVVWGADPFETGDPLSPTQSKNAIPLFANQVLIGHLIPSRRQVLSAFEYEYLHAAAESWWISLLLTALFGLPVSYALGSAFTSPIKRLEHALNSLRLGETPTPLRRNANDEFVALYDSFNSMAVKLTEAYTALETSRETMQKMTRTDDLTGLANRRALREKLADMATQVSLQQPPNALVLLDIDAFKLVNDTFSHTTGDQVLKTFAKILSNSLRQGDFISRHGGDEFVLIIPHTNLSEVQSLVERLRTAVQNYNWHEIHQSLNITLSGGGASFTFNGDSKATIKNAFQAADTNLYKAKARGRNCIVW